MRRRPAEEGSWWDRTVARDHPAVARWTKPVMDLWAELTRVELIDRSLALGAQALLALIPLLMVLRVASGGVGDGGLEQVKDVMGVPDEELRQLLADVDRTPPDITTLSIIVALASATSFSRALQRMYAQAWHVPRYRGWRAIRASVVWLVVWVVMLQTTASLIRWTDAIPLSSLTIQVVATSLIWWWTAHLLLGGRISWAQLLPGGIATGTLLVVLSELSHVFMPAFARANLDQFGPLGIVFAMASWLVVFGGVVIVATVLGRFVSPFVMPAGEQPSWRVRRSRLRA